MYIYHINACIIMKYVYIELWNMYNYEYILHIIIFIFVALLILKSV